MASVKFNCPNCGEEITVSRNRYDRNDSSEYSNNRVPMDVARDITDDVITCATCWHEYRPKFGEVRYVRMYLEDSDG